MKVKCFGCDASIEAGAAAGYFCPIVVTTTTDRLYATVHWVTTDLL